MQVFICDSTAEGRWRGEKSMLPAMWRSASPADMAALSPGVERRNHAIICPGCRTKSRKVQEENRYLLDILLPGWCGHLISRAERRCSCQWLERDGTRKPCTMKQPGRGELNGACYPMPLSLKNPFPDFFVSTRVTWSPKYKVRRGSGYADVWLIVPCSVTASKFARRVATR